MKASVRIDHQLLAVEAEHHGVHAMLELTAPAAPEHVERPPLHLALVIDRSGSMAGPKLETTKECAAFLVRRLSPTDQLALVAYDDEIQLLTPLAPVHTATLLGVIGGIFPGGSTNLSGGWLKGMEALNRIGEDGPRRILLLSDGLANVGIIDRPSLQAMCQNALGVGVGTTTIGFGDGFDEELLTAMSDAGGGRSYYAATPDEAPQIFGEEFEGLASIVAQNLSVEIRPSEAVQVLGILNDYPQVPVEGGVQVQLGDAFSEEQRRVVFELFIPDLAHLGVAKVAEIVVRYVSVGKEVALRELSVPLTVNLVSAAEAQDAEVDDEVAEEVLILKAARAQQEAMRLADGGDFEGAKARLTEAAQDLKAKAPGSEKAAELLAQAEVLEESVTALTPATYDAASRKRMHYQSYQTQRRRPRRRES